MALHQLRPRDLPSRLLSLEKSYELVAMLAKSSLIEAKEGQTTSASDLLMLNQLARQLLHSPTSPYAYVGDELLLAADLFNGHGKTASLCATNWDVRGTRDRGCICQLIGGRQQRGSWRALTWK